MHCYEKTLFHIFSISLVDYLEVQTLVQPVYLVIITTIPEIPLVVLTPLGQTPTPVLLETLERACLEITTLRIKLADCLVGLSLSLIHI